MVSYTELSGDCHIAKHGEVCLISGEYEERHDMLGGVRKMARSVKGLPYTYESEFPMAM